jgi:tripartite-type tricarboxylate transporter receptor subunit TctC
MSFTPVSRALYLALCLMMPSVATMAQGFPSKAVNIVIPYPPGGAGDAIARTVGQRMSEGLGQPVVIVNKPGASQIIAASTVHTAPADGYTVLMASGTSLVLNPLLKKDLPYDPEKGLVLISKWASAPNFLLVSPAIGVNSVQELIQLARAKPGSVNYGSIGNGSNLHIAGEMFASMAKIDIVHVPYKGTAPALTDLMSNRIQMIFDPGTSGLALARDGKLKLLAVTSEKRVPQYPDTPTMVEAGVAGYEIDSWWGLAAPAGTPAAVVNKLAAAVAHAVAQPSLQQFFSKDAIVFEKSTPQSFTDFVRNERVKWRTRMLTLKIDPT